MARTARAKGLRQEHVRGNKKASVAYGSKRGRLLRDEVKKIVKARSCRTVRVTVRTLDFNQS